jgi:hypothetical protein
MSRVVVILGIVLVLLLYQNLFLINCLRVLNGLNQENLIQ